MALHDAQELDNDLGRGSDEHLALTPTLGIDDVVLARDFKMGLSRKCEIILTRQSFYTSSSVNHPSNKTPALTRTDMRTILTGGQTCSCWIKVEVSS
jgi:hypothetical protein